MNDKMINRILAGIAFLASFIVYMKTIAPTVSFWDCGEFIACSYILGVPHPPGAPFYLLIGRIFTLIPLATDIALRVNIISALTTALSVMLTYLITIRLIKLWRGEPRNLEDRILLYAGGLIGALAFGYTDSIWFNAVEAEVYAISLFFTAIVIWLILVWLEKADQIGNERYILMIAYCIGLATGIHLLNVLALPAIFLVVYFKKVREVNLKSLLLLGLAFLATFIVIYQGIVKGIPWLAHETSLSSFPILILVLLAIIYFTVKNRYHLVSLALMCFFLLVMGFSTYAMIFLRSNLDPPIDENDPETSEQLVAYLNRDQYGQWGTFPRRFPGLPMELEFRQTNPGESYEWFNFEKQMDFLWNYQIKKMYLRYFAWQFMGQGTTLGTDNFIVENFSFRGLLGLPFLIGLIGMFHHFKKDWRHSLSVLTLFIMTGVAIVFYLNQEDPQPRERDYVFVASFMAFAFWIGIGVTAILEYIKELIKNQEVRKVAYTAAIAVLVVAAPVNLIAFNYHTHDRTGNFVAYDYSYNLLQTCEKDAIVFTNGDNDTFPLWFLQYVYGIRTDVRVVNLSLLNTPWYIKQLKNEEPRVPISLTDVEIERLEPIPWRKTPIRIPVPTEVHRQFVNEMSGQSMRLAPDTEGVAEISFDLEPTLYGRGIRVQDLMILNIIHSNRWQKPIYFAVTVSNDNKVNLHKYLRMDGLDTKLVTYGGDNISPERLEENLFNRFKFRGLNDPTVYYNDNILGLLQNYRAAFLSLAYHYATINNQEKLLKTLEKMEAVMPEKVIPYSDDRLAERVGQLYAMAGKPDEYINRLMAIKKRDPNNGMAVGRLLMMLQQQKRYGEAADMLEEWYKNHPDDQEAGQKMLEFRKLAATQDSLARLGAQKPIGSSDSLAAPNPSDSATGAR